MALEQSGNHQLANLDYTKMTSVITAAYVSGHSVPATEIPGIITSVYAALRQLGTPAEPAEEKRVPAVSIRKSVTPDYIVCLEDGKKLKMLKRYLRSTYGMTPDEYRARWDLPADYPMVAPNYAARRSEFAKQIGLGRKPEAVQPIPEPVQAGAKRGRKPASVRTAAAEQAVAAETAPARRGRRKAA